MMDDDNTTGVSRRATLTLAAGIAALGLSLGMRSNAFAQGKGEGKMDAKGEGKFEGKGEGKYDGKGEGKYEGKGEGKYEGKGEGKYEGKGEGKYDGKGEGKYGGKEGRRDGKAGRIKVDVDADGTTSVDVKCAEDEPMRQCADITKEIIDRIKGAPKP